MVLRSAKPVKLNQSPKSWWVFGEIKRISYEPTEFRVAKSDPDTEVTITGKDGEDIKETPDLLNCWPNGQDIVRIHIYHLDESIYNILTNMPTYLCNNTGDTIERVV